jgi:DNA-directed RNA polymerase subunit RPC12/RpoP
MNDDLECPYCQKAQEAGDENRDPTDVYEHECIRCGKTFRYMVDWSPTYIVEA